MCLRTTKQWLRWLSKVEFTQWDMFPEPTELRLIGYSIESIWTTKIQIKCMDAKNQLADMLTKGNFTRDEWNHLLCLFNISHFSSSVCSEAMAKRSQQDSGEERVTAKARPMMSLIARAPSKLSSSTSESRVKRSYGSQDPWSAKAERERIERSNPLWLLGERHTNPKQVSFMRRPSTVEQRNPLWTRQHLVIERGNPLCSLKKK